MNRWEVYRQVFSSCPKVPVLELDDLFKKLFPVLCTFTLLLEGRKRKERCAFSGTCTCAQAKPQDKLIKPKAVSKPNVLHARNYLPVRFIRIPAV
jgi:hypothetical protein